MDRPFWVGVHLGWKAAALIITGDVAVGKRFLDEEFELLTQNGDQFFISFNYGHQARIATQEGRLEDAVDLFTRSVDVTRELGHTRGMQFGLHSLGEAHLAVGNLEAAETAFTESLAAAEQMGMLREMLGMIAKIATVRALTGRKVDAVELNATVVADPGSAQLLLTAAETIGEGATAVLATLEAEMDPDEYAVAHARGTSTAYDVAAKELIGGLTQT
jgi:tetratricopeptide (TPR) repeat protein